MAHTGRASVRGVSATERRALPPPPKRYLRIRHLGPGRMAQRIAPRPAPCHRATLVPNQISCCSLTRLRSRRLPDLRAARAEGALLARRRRGGEPCRVCHALFAEEEAGRRGGGGAGEEQALSRPPDRGHCRIVPPTPLSTSKARAVRPRRRPLQRPRQRARRLVLRLQLGADARRRGGEGAGRRRLAQGGGSVGGRAWRESLGRGLLWRLKAKLLFFGGWRLLLGVR